MVGFKSKLSLFTCSTLKPDSALERKALYPVFLWTLWTQHSAWHQGGSQQTHDEWVTGRLRASTLEPICLGFNPGPTVFWLCDTGQASWPLCDSISSSVKRDNNSTYLIGQMWGWSRFHIYIIFRRVIGEWLAQGRSSVNTSYYCYQHFHWPLRWIISCFLKIFNCLFYYLFI